MIVQKKLIVTGAHGFVAGSVLGQAGAEWQVHAVSRSQPAVKCGGFRWHVIDGAGQWAELFNQVRPDAVIHTAALADIDFCETHPAEARSANVELTRIIAGFCAEVGTKFVLCSTDTIFNGEQAPYVEQNSPAPINHYAKTKVEAEEIAAGLGSHAVIARLALVVGLPVLGAGNSFLARMLATFREGREIPLSQKEVRTPVDVLTVGQALLELAQEDHRGIFHLSGNERLNRFEIGQQIAAGFGFSKNLVVPQTMEATPGRAIRPRDVSLDNSKARANLKTPMRNFDEGLALILKNAGMRTP
ncbi:MAG: NAD(P)-dependent oxidoreductase [Verrucomicrobiota bacterium]